MPPAEGRDGVEETSMRSRLDMLLPPESPDLVPDGPESDDYR